MTFSISGDYKTPAVKSRHLERILRKENQIAHMQVVFCDVQLYSKRNSRMMMLVVKQLNDLLRHCLVELQKTHSTYIDAHDLSLLRDVITLPTGDGAAVVFTFPSLHDIHIAYAEMLLAKVLQIQDKPRCPKFDEQSWCICHPYMNLRIGISEGRGIVYEDLNGRLNVAGEPVNMASRAMSIARPNQIVLTENAYRQLMDLTADEKMSLDFVEIRDAIVKHDAKMTVFRYTRTRPVRRYKVDTVIDSRVEADIEVEGDLIVGENAVIVGNIVAKRIFVYGSVRGDLHGERIEVKSLCRILGNIKTARFIIEEGATFIGRMELSYGFVINF